MARRAIAAALAIAGAAVLSGCSVSHTIIDAMPASVGGLPEGTPERPATPTPYPAVHSMPPSRTDTPLSEAEKKRLREELIATRERNAREATTTGAIAPAGSARNP